MARKLAAALKRFARYGARIEQEIFRNPEFRLLCEDYGDAVGALERWERAGDPVSRHKASEYRQLVEDLGREIEDHLRLPSAG